MNVVVVCSDRNDYALSQRIEIPSLLAYGTVKGHKDPDVAAKFVERFRQRTGHVGKTAALCERRHFRGAEKNLHFEHSAFHENRPGERRLQSLVVDKTPIEKLHAAAKWFRAAVGLPRSGLGRPLQVRRCNGVLR
jgi:hypothetical protein